MSKETERELPWVDTNQVYEERLSTGVTWHEIGEEQYVQMIECVPPAAGGYGYCLVGEAYTHDRETGKRIFPAVKEQDGRFWLTLMTGAEYRSGQYRYHQPEMQEAIHA